MGKIINFIKDLISPPRMSKEPFDTGHYIVVRDKKNTSKTRKYMQGVSRDGYPLVMVDNFPFLKDKHVEVVHKGRLTKKEIAYNAEIDKKLAVESQEQQL